MKTRLLALLLSLFSAASFAQERKGFIGLGLGPSLPLGEFAKKTPVSSSGYAKAGIAADISAGYQLTPKAGAMLLFKSQLNGHSTEGFFKEEAESNGWLTRALMVGPFMAVPLGAKKMASLEVRALAGYCRTRTPEVTASDLPSLGTSRVLMKSRKANSLALLAGAGFRFPVSDRIGFSIHADYFLSRPDLPPQASTLPPQKLNISTVSTTLSFQYRFLKVLQTRSEPGLLDNGTF